MVKSWHVHKTVTSFSFVFSIWDEKKQFDFKTWVNAIWFDSARTWEWFILNSKRCPVRKQTQIELYFHGKRDETKVWFELSELPSVASLEQLCISKIKYGKKIPLMVKKLFFNPWNQPSETLKEKKNQWLSMELSHDFKEEHFQETILEFIYPIYMVTGHEEIVNERIEHCQTPSFYIYHYRTNEFFKQVIFTC